MCIHNYIHVKYPCMETSPPCRFQPPKFAVYRSSRKTISTDTIGKNGRQILQGSNSPPSLTSPLPSPYQSFCNLKNKEERGGGLLPKGFFKKGRKTTVFYWLLPRVIIVFKIPFYYLHEICTRSMQEGWKQRRKQQPSGFVVAALLCNNCVQASAVDSIFPAWRQDNEGDLSCSRFISKSFCALLCLVWLIVHAQSCLIKVNNYTFVDENNTCSHVVHMWV